MNWTDADTYKSTSGLKKYDVSFFEFTQDTGSIFPSLVINDEMVPIGTAQPVCVHFQWTRGKSPFKPVSNQPDCSFVSAGTWNDNDPVTGVDVSNWITSHHECTSRSCKDNCNKKEGWWAADRCYTYKILNTICVVVKKHKDAFGRESLEFESGCFSGGAGKYSKGEPGKKYRFENVRIEVRDSMDPFLSAVGATSDDAEFSTSLRSVRLLAILLFVGFLGSALAFAVVFWKSKMQYKQMD